MENKIQEWFPTELNQKNDKPLMIDVRFPEEFTGPLSHIKGAKLVTLGPDLEIFLSSSKSQLSNDLIVFICRSGKRSMAACEQGRALGYKNLINLNGGMIAWNEAGLPTEGKK